MLKFKEIKRVLLANDAPIYRALKLPAQGKPLGSYLDIEIPRVASGCAAVVAKHRRPVNDIAIESAYLCSLASCRQNASVTYLTSRQFTELWNTPISPTLTLNEIRDLNRAGLLMLPSATIKNRSNADCSFVGFCWYYVDETFAPPIASIPTIKMIDSGVCAWTSASDERGCPHFGTREAMDPTKPIAEYVNQKLASNGLAELVDEHGMIRILNSEEEVFINYIWLIAVKWAVQLHANRRP